MLRLNKIDAPRRARQKDGDETTNCSYHHFQLSARQEFVIKISHRFGRSATEKFLTPEANIFNRAQPRNMEIVTKFEHLFSFKTVAAVVVGEMRDVERIQMRISVFGKRETFRSCLFMWSEFCCL